VTIIITKRGYEGVKEGNRDHLRGPFGVGKLPTRRGRKEESPKEELEKGRANRETPYSS